MKIFLFILIIAICSVKSIYANNEDLNQLILNEVKQINKLNVDIDKINKELKKSNTKTINDIINLALRGEIAIEKMSKEQKKILINALESIIDNYKSSNIYKKIYNQTVEFIKEKEGYSKDCYKDTDGVWVIGYGSKSLGKVHCGFFRQTQTTEIEASVEIKNKVDEYLTLSIQEIIERMEEEIKNNKTENLKWCLKNCKEKIILKAMLLTDLKYNCGKNVGVEKFLDAIVLDNNKQIQVAFLRFSICNGNKNAGLKARRNDLYNKYVSLKQTYKF